MFRHYKGGLYRAVGDCTIEATGSPGVLYQAVDPLKADVVWMRPALDFHQEVGPGVARFAPVRRATDAALRKALPPSLIEAAALEKVLQCYSEPWRFFHDQVHLFELFWLAEARGIALTAEQALALLFHDVVYVPGAPAGHNEAQSALLVRGFASSFGSAVDLEKVRLFILETADHLATSEESAVVQALDLGSLAAAPLEFAAVNELVWLENRHLIEGAERKAFDTARLKFLLQLATNETMFAPGFEDLEEAARTNIEGLRLAWVQRYGPARGG